MFTLANLSFSITFFFIQPNEINRSLRNLRPLTWHWNEMFPRDTIDFLRFGSHQMLIIFIIILFADNSDWLVCSFGFGHNTNWKNSASHQTESSRMHLPIQWTTRANLKLIADQLKWVNLPFPLRGVCLLFISNLPCMKRFAYRWLRNMHTLKLARMISWMRWIWIFCHSASR